MSRKIFKFFSPAFIVAAIILFVVVLPNLRQHLLLDFCVGYYIMVWISRWRYGPPIQLAAAPLPAKHSLQPRQAKMLREIALHEYEYIRETMAQAMNDRHTLVNYFLLTTGLVIAAIGVIHSQEGMRGSPYTDEITIAISLILSLVAWIYLLKIVRLRQAWCESSVAMNRVKQFYLVNIGLTDGHESSPFLWKSESLPRAAKKGNLYHLEFILISVIAALAVGLASVMLLPDGRWDNEIWVPFLFFLHHFLLNLAMYDVFLAENPASRKKIVRETDSGRAPSGFDPSASAGHASPRRVVVHERETVYKNFFEIQKATLQFEKFDGTLSGRVQRFNSERGHSAAILLHDPVQGEFVLVEQFRYPAYVFSAEKSWLIEVVAGLIEKGENPQEVARREALEETGCEVHDIEFISEFFPSPGGSSERIFIFFGRVGQKVAPGGGMRSESEDIRVVRMPVREAYRLIDHGVIHDAKTLVALLSVRERVAPAMASQATS